MRRVGRMGRLAVVRCDVDDPVLDRLDVFRGDPADGARVVDAEERDAARGVGRPLEGRTHG